MLPAFVTSYFRYGLTSVVALITSVFHFAAFLRLPLPLPMTLTAIGALCCLAFSFALCAISDVPQSKQTNTGTNVDVTTTNSGRLLRSHTSQCIGIVCKLCNLPIACDNSLSVNFLMFIYVFSFLILLSKIASGVRGAYHAVFAHVPLYAPIYIAVCTCATFVALTSPHCTLRSARAD